MALIKREILTSRKILSTKSCMRNQFLFCKKMLCKIRIFLAQNAGLSKEKLTHLLCNDFSCFKPTKEWVNKVNLSSFELENFFKFVLA